MAIHIRNWEKFQHFKDRRPPWIKIYRELLDDPEWYELPDKAAKVLVMLWLVASEDEHRTGTLPCLKKLAFRLRMTEPQLNQILTSLSHWLVQDDINMISQRYQVDAPETEGEGEAYKKEREAYKKETDSSDLKKDPQKRHSYTRSPKKPAQPVVPSKTGEVWESYKMAYLRRYHVEPIRNQQVNAMLSKFVDRVGKDLAPFIAEFYVGHNAQYYVQRMHPVKILLADAEKLATECRTGQKMTQLEAKSAEFMDSTAAQLQRLSKL